MYDFQVFKEDNTNEKGYVWVIYKHTSPSGKIYIGQTNQKLKDRFRKGEGYVHCRKFYPAICKYGWEAFETEIIEEGITSKQQANEREKYWIKYYDSYNNGYNATPGGDERGEYIYPVYQIDKDTKQIIAEYVSVPVAAKTLGIYSSTIYECLNGNLNSCCNSYWAYKEEYEEWKEPQYFYKQAIYSPTLDKNFDNANDVVKAFPELSLIDVYNNCAGRTKQTFLGIVFEYINPDVLLGVRPGVAVRRLDTKEEFISIIEAARKTKTNYHSLCKCLSGKLRMANNIQWDYIDGTKEYDPNLKKEIAVKVYNLLTKESVFFSSEKEATDYIGCGISSISDSLHTHRIIYEKYCVFYPNEEIKIPQSKRGINTKKKVQCTPAIQDEPYESMSQAQELTGVAKSSISKVLNNPNRSAGKHPVTKEKLRWYTVE